MLRRIEYAWIDDKWPSAGHWPIYVLAAPPGGVDDMVCDAFQLRRTVLGWDALPQDLAFLNQPEIQFLGGLFHNTVFSALVKQRLAATFVRDALWVEQPTQSPLVGIQHFRIVNGLHNEIRGGCLFLYPSPPSDPAKQKDLSYWQCAHLFENFKSQTRISSNWQLDLPITDSELPQTGLVYVMESEIKRRYKIGWTVRDPSERLAEIRTANSEVRLVATYPATKQLERILHKVFQDKRVREAGEAGQEWFDLTEDDIAWIHRVLT